MSVRDFTFLTGIETSTQPTTGTPTSDNDTITKGWLEEYGFDRRAIRYFVADVNAAKAISVSTAIDGQLMVVDSLGTGGLFKYDKDSSASADDVTVIQPTVGSGRWLIIGGSGSGGGGSVSQAYAFESISANSNPKAVAFTEKQILSVVAANSWIDINEGSGEVSTQIISNDTRYLLTDLSDSADTFDFAKVVTDALNANGSLTTGYSFTYSKSTRTFTISHSSVTFSVLLNTGTHAGTTSLLENLGFGTSDLSGTTSYTAASTIDSSDLKDTGTYIVKCDADYLEKSGNYAGVIDTSATKGTQPTVKFAQEVDGFTLDEGKKYYTKSAAIVIDSTNQNIDFSESAGGGETNVTIANATYYRGSDAAGNSGYADLCAAIKSTMEAGSSNALTYTVTYNKGSGTDVDKFVISATGDFNLLNSTGTNASTAFLVLDGGFAASDTGNASSHTADNVVDLAGEIGVSTAATANSVYAGFASSATHLVAKQNSSLSDYSDIYSAPIDALASSRSIRDHGSEIQFHGMAENASGEAVLFFSKIASPAEYRFMYRTAPGGNWSLSASTITLGESGAQSESDNFNGGQVQYKGDIAIDPDGYCVAAVTRINSSGQRTVWAVKSNDGGVTWSTANGGAALKTNASVSYGVGGIVIREQKCAILTTDQNGSDSNIFYSDRGGGGYETYSNTGLTKDYLWDRACFVTIQYFVGETGVNKYRIVTGGFNNSDTRTYLEYWKGDLTGNGTVQPFGTTSTKPYAWAIDSDTTGVKNRICLVTINGSTATLLYQGETNEDYNGGTLTFNNHTTHTIFSGATLDQYVGQATANEKWFILSINDRMVLRGNACYMLLESNENPSSAISLMLLYTKNITGGTWETRVNVGQSTGNNQKPTMEYIPSLDAVFYLYKHNSNTLANNLTNGKAYGRILELQSDGSYSALTTQELDGGKSMSGKLSYIYSAASVDGVGVVWEEDGGSYDILKGNDLR